MNSTNERCVSNYRLIAADDATIIAGQVVRVTAEGPDGLAVMESFEMTVRQ